MNKRIVLFEKFISEDNSIYHSTDIDALFAILFQNQLAGISPQEIDGKMYRGISCSKDKNFIYKNSDITIELDADALSKKWNLVNVDFFSTQFGKEKQEKHDLDIVDEKEVFIVTGDIDSNKSIKPLNKYLISIKLNKKDLVLPEDIKEIININFNFIKIFNHLNKDITNKIIIRNDNISFDSNDFIAGFDEFK